MGGHDVTNEEVLSLSLCIYLKHMFGIKDKVNVLVFTSGASTCTHVFLKSFYMQRLENVEVVKYA